MPEDELKLKEKATHKLIEADRGGIIIPLSMFKADP
jgi:hypothetical protein